MLYVMKEGTSEGFVKILLNLVIPQKSVQTAVVRLQSKCDMMGQ